MKQTSKGQIKGILKRHPDGFGFVIPDDKKYPDIYIPSTKIGSALTNDRVSALVYQKRKGGDRSYYGFITNILKRDKKFVVGVFDKKQNQNFIISHNLDFREPIPLINSKQISVQKGDYIRAKIKFQKANSPKKRRDRFFKQDSFLTADLSENLGSVSSLAKDDVKRVMAEFDIAFEFPDSVLQEIKQLPDEVREKDYSDRINLRQKAFVTIDGATAQDFDDAIYIEKHKSFYRLFVAIADVSYYVQEDSELDKSAFERGNSSYFPNFCSPMLPEKLSNDLCSLKEGKDRLVMVQEIDFDFQGESQGSKLYPSVIKSQKRLTYGQAQEILDQFSSQEKTSQLNGSSKSSTLKALDQKALFNINLSSLSLKDISSTKTGDQPSNKIENNYLQSLKSAQELAQILIKKHIKELAFDLDIPETLILVDKEGEPQDILREQRLFAHKMIEQFMLSANKAVSSFLEKKKIDFMYRIHESPDPDKLQVLQNFSKALGFSKSLKSRKSFVQFLKQYKNHQKSALIHKLTLRSLAQARYSSFNKGHYGLNFKSYTHFTSPIRRYCDLQIHRFIRQALKQKSSQNPIPISEKKSKMNYVKKIKTSTEKELEHQAECISAREQNSVKAERRVKDIKSARFLKQYVGENLKGSVSSVTNFGLFISLKTFFVEGLVRYQDIRGFWEVDEFLLYAKNKKTSYKIQLGDEVEVLVTASNIQTGQLDFKLISHKGKSFK